MDDLFNAKSIPSDDFGFLYGFSLFETFLVDEGGSVFLLDKHLDRLYASIEFFGFDPDMEKGTLLDALTKYIKQENLKNKILRVTVSNGNNSKNIKPSFTLTTRNNPYDLSEISNKGFKLSISKCKKDENAIIARHKTSNYLENLLQGRLASKQGFDDALFLNTGLNVAETTKSNIFFVTPGIIYTPDTNCGILPGIIRSWVIEELQNRNIPCRQGQYPLEMLLKADEVFVTNSVFGIMPVHFVGNTRINKGMTGEITDLLIKAYKDKHLKEPV